VADEDCQTTGIVTAALNRRWRLVIRCGLRCHWLPVFLCAAFFVRLAHYERGQDVRLSVQVRSRGAQRGVIVRGKIFDRRSCSLAQFSAYDHGQDEVLHWLLLDRRGRKIPCFHNFKVLDLVPPVRVAP
jgi:hypothetical protein